MQMRLILRTEFHQVEVERDSNQFSKWSKWCEEWINQPWTRKREIEVTQQRNCIIWRFVKPFNAKSKQKLFNHLKWFLITVKAIHTYLKTKMWFSLFWFKKSNILSEALLNFWKGRKSSLRKLNQISYQAKASI